jgi:very-short-patch-repair endonuclease
MQTSTALLIAVAALAVVGSAVVEGLKKQPAKGAVNTTAKPPLTKHEQAMYWRLRETFPDLVVLAQVAFSALITSRREDRNRYDRKTADFVLCDRALVVVAVIELEDASHAGREGPDKARAALLESAGYRVLRFPRIPDATALKAQVEQTTTSTPSRP